MARQVRHTHKGKLKCLLMEGCVPSTEGCTCVQIEDLLAADVLGTCPFPRGLFCNHSRVVSSSGQSVYQFTLFRHDSARLGDNTTQPLCLSEEGRQPGGQLTGWPLDD
eukprot:m.95010 g.95010  ORF g.95010 m.95010 type:complete len:108 (+) comp12313_c0_seq4:804-1127(+)